MAETLKITKQGKGTPLVFLHGWGLNSGVWEPLATDLANSFEVITIDLPGFGKNAHHSVNNYSLETIAKEILQAVSYPAVYVGWSLGGLIATYIAVYFPQKTLGLVNVASSPCFREQPDWPGIKSEVLAAFHQQLAENTKKTITGFLNIQAMGSPNLRSDVKQIKSLVMQYELPSRNTLDDALVLLENVDLRDDLKKLQLPSLYILGALDSLIPRKAIPLIERLTPTSKFYILDKSSHAPFISHPQEFISALSCWLKSLPSK